MVYMQFFTVLDEFNVKHKVLVITLSQTEMNEVVGQCEKCMPSIAVSSLIQIGHPYVIVDFGGGGWKTAIPLDKESEDGHRVGDELEVGDVLNVILTADKEAVSVSRDKVYMNVPLEAVLAFSFIYTADMAENYALFNLYRQPKGE
ncbi:MAG: hypothetical protein NWE98_09390 [Candidatus Bathyarchaeota archaeon]|nr:hypothetical protein [Candidatus Bathyarchaeota archaeon]